MVIGRWREAPYLHDSLAAPAGQDHGFLLLEHDTPDGFGWLAELAHESTSGKIPDFDTAIAASADYAAIVELQ